MASRSVKREREVVRDVEDEETVPFDEDSTNLDDPLADDDSKTDCDEMKVKEEENDCDGDGGRRLRSHSQPSPVKYVKRLKVFILEPEPKRIGHSNGGRRPKYATEEERRKARAEMARQRRAKLREENPEKYEEYLRRVRDAKSQRRAKLKEEAENSIEEANGTPEELEKAKERKRRWREQVLKDPEKYEEMLRKKRENARKRREQNPEKYQEQIRKNAERKRKLKEDPVKYAEFREKERIRFRQKGYHKKSSKKETEEKKELRRQKRREHYRKETSTPEGRARERFRQYSRVQMKLAQMTDEERKAYTQKNTEACKKWRYNLTGEKLERYRETMRRNQQKQFQNPEFLKRNRERAKAYSRYRCSVETPEERQKRLRRYKINQAITKLRKQLNEIGVTQEEVERRVKELRSQMEAEPLPPPETLSEFKPRIKGGLNYVPRQYGGKRRGRRPGGSGSQSQTVPGSTSETKADVSFDSNDFDDHDHGFQCDDLDDDNEAIKTEEDISKPLPVIRFDINCPHCPSTYSERSDLISHIGSEHSKICWKCPKCKLIVLSSDELSEHYKKEHFSFPKKSTDSVATSTAESVVSKEAPPKKQNIFTCIKCDPSTDSQRTFESVKDLMEHVKSNHSKSYWPCSKCNLLKYTESSLKLHQRICKRVRTRTTIKRNERNRMVRNK